MANSRNFRRLVIAAPTKLPVGKLMLVGMMVGLIAGCTVISREKGLQAPDAAPRDEIEFELLPPLDTSSANLSGAVALPLPGSAPTDVAVPGGATSGSACRGEALYRITFAATWSPETHPARYPDGAHFSRPVAISHSAGAGFWAFGNFASAGVEQMAESGGTQILREELTSLNAGGQAGEAVIGNSFAAPGEETMELSVTADRPQISYVSMLAPSPDWFVGVSGLDTCGRNGWIEEIEVAVFPIDAGTDDGRSFGAENVDSDTKHFVALLSASGDTPLRDIGRLEFGKLLFTRIGTSSETATVE